MVADINQGLRAEDASDCGLGTKMRASQMVCGARLAMALALFGLAGCAAVTINETTPNQYIASESTSCATLAELDTQVKSVAYGGISSPAGRSRARIEVSEARTWRNLSDTLYAS
jgi:hypothetical protein